MPGTVKSDLLSYADRITKCERQEKGRGGGAGPSPVALFETKTAFLKSIRFPLSESSWE